MSFPVTRLGDVGDHGGAVVITGRDNHYVNGLPIARVGDLVDCPIHGVSQIVATTAPTVFTNNGQNSHIGSVAECGAVIVTGSPDMQDDY